MKRLPLPLGYGAFDACSVKWSWVDSNHRSSPCKGAAFAAGLQDHCDWIFRRKPWDSNPQAASPPPPVFKTGSSSSRMTSPRCPPAVSSWRVRGIANCGGWDRTSMTTFRVSRPTVRRPRISNAFHELRGQESNLQTRGSKPRISTSRNYPAMSRAPVRHSLCAFESAVCLRLRTECYLSVEECPAGVEPA